MSLICITQRSCRRLAVPAIILGVCLLSCFSAPAGAGPAPLKIGVTVSLEGKYLETSAMIRNGYRLWADQVNRRGGLLGRPVELVLYDDKSQKDLVAGFYEKMITRDKVDLVLSPYGTPLTLAASEVTEEHGFVMLACAAAGPQIWDRGYKYVFGVYALADRYFIGFQDLMARNGFSRLGIVFEASAFHRSAADGAAQWARRFGLNLVVRAGFAPSGAQLPEILETVAKEKPDGLIFSGYPPDCYRFITLMEQAGFRPPALLFTIAPIHPDFPGKAGAFSEGVFAPSQWEPDERIPFPGTRRFITDFTAFASRPPSYHAASAYSACQILEQAVIHANGLDQDKIRHYIHSLDTVTIMGRFKVDHTGRQVGHNPILIQWQNRKKEIVYPSKMRTAKPVLGRLNGRRPNG